MTNDQKLLLLISKTEALLKALDKQDETNGAFLYKEEARKQRRDLKVWLAGNRLVTTPKTPVHRRTPNNYGFNQNFLGR